ncbi:unnamed protein product [Thlaspi arvense]|uniref:F-box domain-containing protein n=1 Tax=Thlaspi arvense TaxID=13288 RepID=A0AAU9RG76_THLAR|nr:unnamed protein product [Thlaspi arvense]
MLWKKQRCCLRIPSLPHDVVELILERVPVKSLGRFKAVSKQWKSTIEDPFFQHRQLKQRQQSGDPDVLMVSVHRSDDIDYKDMETLSTLVLGSTATVNIPIPWEKKIHLASVGGCCGFLASYGSCDGLVCLYSHFFAGFVVNPTTRWYRPLPLCQMQQLIADLGLDAYMDLGHDFSNLGFGKDRFTGTYKPVWLYNSSEKATTCEVFDFTTNAWRYVTPAAPCRVVGPLDPVFVDGSLHWFTACEETKVVSFDHHTEAFHVICKAPFANVHPSKMGMCNLDDRLCVSEMKWPNQVIWSLNSGTKTWDKFCSIDLQVTSHWFGNLHGPLAPLTLFHGEEEKKMLFHNRGLSKTLLVHDLETGSYHAAFDAESIGEPVCYFQSLISIS